MKTTTTLFVPSVLAALAALGCSASEVGETDEGSLSVTARSTLVRAELRAEFVVPNIDFSNHPQRETLKKCAEAGTNVTGAFAFRCTDFRQEAAHMCHEVLARSNVPRPEPMIAAATGLKLEELRPYNMDGPGGLIPVDIGYWSGLIRATSSGFELACAIARTPRYVIANAETKRGTPKDYASIDGRTYSTAVVVPNRIDMKAQDQHALSAAAAGTVQATLTFDPLKAPPTVTPKYDQLTERGVVNVLMASHTICSPNENPSYIFMGTRQADDEIRAVRARATKWGFVETAYEPPIQSAELDNGEGWSLVFEKTLAGQIVRLRAAGSVVHAKGIKQANLRQWNSAANIVLYSKDATLCDDLMTAPASKYRVEVLDLNYTSESYGNFDGKLLTSGGDFTGSAPNAPFTEGERVWLTSLAGTNELIDGLVTGVGGGARPTFNQMVVDASPYLQIYLGGDARGATRFTEPYLSP